MELVRKDGTRFTGELQLTAVRHDGVPAGFACIVYDVTAKRKVEEQLRQAAAIAQSAKAGFDILVSAVYWRLNDHVAVGIHAGRNQAHPAVSRPAPL